MRRALCHIENCRRWTKKFPCVDCWRVVCGEHTVFAPSKGGSGKDPYCVICATRLNLLNAGVTAPVLQIIR